MSSAASSETASIVSDGASLFTVSYCFEVEFLVAQERPGMLYNDNGIEYDSDDSDSKYNQELWACPHDVQDAYDAILDRCKEVLVQNDEPVAVYRDGDRVIANGKRFNTHRAGTSPRFGTWSISPSSNATARKGSPENYKWFGVKLRSPMLSESEYVNSDSLVFWALGALRMGIRMHVNSTCNFNVHVQPGPEPMRHLLAKKLVTLVWLTEATLLTKLCPARSSELMTVASRGATTALTGNESRPADLLLGALTYQNVPAVHDSDAHAKLQRMWAAADLEKLSQLLRSEATGEASACFIRTFDKTAEPKELPTIEFRYGVWHPYDSLDATNHWIRLTIAYVRATQLIHYHFKAFVTSIDGINQKPHDEHHWTILLDRLGFPGQLRQSWEMIVAEYKEGGALGPSKIDEHPELGLIQELRRPWKRLKRLLGFMLHLVAYVSYLVLHGVG